MSFVLYFSYRGGSQNVKTNGDIRRICFSRYRYRDTCITILVSSCETNLIFSPDFTTVSFLSFFFFFFIIIIFLTRSFRVHARRQSKTHGKLIPRVTTGLYLYRLQTKPVARKLASKRSLWACIVNAPRANLAKRRLFERLH